MKRAAGTPASRSPLIDLEAELRTIERKRRTALRKAHRAERFEVPARITPGAWSELETTVYLEQTV